MAAVRYGRLALHPIPALVLRRDQLLLLVPCALNGRRIDTVRDIVRFRQVLGQVCQVLRELDRIQQTQVDQVLLDRCLIRRQVLQETHSLLDRVHLQDLVASGADRRLNLEQGLDHVRELRTIGCCDFGVDAFKHPLIEAAHVIRAERRFQGGHLIEDAAE